MSRKRRGRRTVRIPSEAYDLGARLMKAFGFRIGQRGSLTVAGEAMGMGEGKMHRVKSHRLGGRPVEMFGGLISVGDPNPRDVCHQAFEEIPRNYVAILAGARENQSDLEPNLFLIALRPRLQALAAAWTEEHGVWRGQLAMIRSFERERLNDWRRTAAKLEWIIGLLLFFLGKPSLRTAEALGDLAGALCALAAAYRIGGRRDDANDVLRMTRPLVDWVDIPLVEGLWLQKSGYLLVDVNRCDRAYEFIEEAALCFMAAGATADQGRVLVDLGYVLSHAKQSDAALKVLRRALPLIEAKDLSYRFAVHQLQFIQLRRLGRYEEALAELDHAFRFADDLSLYKARLHWGRAKLAILLHQTAEVASDFESALCLYRQFGSPAEVTEVTLEFAQWLLVEGRQEEVKGLVGRTSLWATDIKGNSKVRDVLENFTALDQLNKVDADSIAEIRKGLPSKKEPAPRYRRRKAQPPGGASSPISGSELDAPLGGNSMPISGSGSPLAEASPSGGISLVGSSPEPEAPFGGNCMPISPKSKVN